MTQRLRVLVVEDSVTVRRKLCEVLASDPEFEVVGEAEDGQAAVERCIEHRPDVVTMDMMLASTTGLVATERIMERCPTPILVVSSSFNRGEVLRTYDALAAGAVDVIEKPLGTEPEGDWERRFLSALRIVARVRVVTHRRSRLDQARARSVAPRPLPASRTLPQVAAIGASTGGPSAIVSVLSGLPESFTQPILVVLHIGAPFAPAFADWLSSQVPRPVAFAKEGESLATLSGAVRLAPPDQHLTLIGRRLRLTRDPERHFCRPSADVLFESLAADLGSATAACLLTGMGRDGAAGLLALRRAGATTVAQNEETSVVYGMPREAVLLGAAEHVLPLGEVGAFLGSLNRPRTGGPA